MIWEKRESLLLCVPLNITQKVFDNFQKKVFFFFFLAGGGKKKKKKLKRYHDETFGGHD